MKKKLVCVGLLVVLTALCASAAPAPASDNGLSFFIEPLLLKGLGRTAYDLLYYDSSTGENVYSRLEFPAASLEAGINAGLSIEKNGKKAWLFGASFAHSFLGWQARMHDYDWFGFPGEPRIPWSYSYSTDTTTSWRLSAEAAWMFHSLGPLSFFLYATYHYQYAYHVEDTLTGWRYTFDAAGTPDGLRSGTDSTTDVLEYTLTAHMPGLGLMAELETLPGLSLELRAAFTPVYVSDSDDHKLRNKLSTADGWGVGLYTKLRGKYQFPEYYKGFSTYIALDGELIYYSVSTTQTQYWYADGDEPKGTKYTGIGHVITSTQLQVGLSFGFAF